MPRLLFPCVLIILGLELVSLAQETTAENEVDQLIASKERELTALRQTMLALERDLAGLRQRSSGAMPSLQKLLDEIPEDSQPRNGRDFVIERNKANLWATKNLIGKEVELTLRVDFVNISPRGGENVYSVTVFYEELVRPGADQRLHARSQGEVQAGGNRIFVQVERPSWERLDEDTARKIRDLKGKPVLVRGKIALPKTKSVFSDGYMEIGLTEVTIDGFDPSKP